MCSSQGTSTVNGIPTKYKKKNDDSGRSTNLLDGAAIVLAEVRNRLVVWRQPTKYRTEPLPQCASLHTVRRIAHRHSLSNGIFVR